MPSDGRIAECEEGDCPYLLRAEGVPDAERRFFPEMLKPWNPLFADYIDDYVARRSSTLRDPSGSGRYARYWKEAPETRGKTMRQLSVEDFERYRERRRQGGAIGAQRARGGASPSTTNKELSFARAVFNDFIASLEARGLLPNANPVRNRKGRRLFADEAPTRTPVVRPERRRRRGTAAGRTVRRRLVKGAGRDAHWARPGSTVLAALVAGRSTDAHDPGRAPQATARRGGAGRHPDQR